MIFSRQTGASHRRAVVCEQLAQGCYLRVQWSLVRDRTPYLAVIGSYTLTTRLAYQATPKTTTYRLDFD